MVLAHMYFRPPVLQNETQSEENEEIVDKSEERFYKRRRERLKAKKSFFIPAIPPSAAGRMVIFSSGKNCSEMIICGKNEQLFL